VQGGYANDLSLDIAWQPVLSQSGRCVHVDTERARSAAHRSLVRLPRGLRGLRAREEVGRVWAQRYALRRGLFRPGR
jgi:hypothetical protein